MNDSEAATRLNAALGGRYAIESELGVGGMATVYLADDLKHERKVALKVLKPELAAVVGAERFLAEIKTTANLQHPHILPLFDSGEADNFLFYVMPYVKGESLRERLDREKQLPIDEAVHIAGAAASALDYAHRQGVIHRDMKPGNVLLHDGEPVVADFGIALAVSAAGGARLTETGLSLGTPYYMSPEQAAGDRQLDARADVYSLAAMLYEMLSGEPPYTGGTAQAILAKVLTERVTPIRQRRDTVPGHIEAALQRALAKLPADRFRTAGEFREAIQGKVAVEPTRVGPRKRRRTSVLAAAAAAVAIGAFYVGRLSMPATTAIGASPPSQRQVTFVGSAGTPSISPSSNFVAHVAHSCAPGESCRAQFWVQELSGGNPIRVRLDIADLPPGIGPWYAWTIGWSPDEATLVLTVRHEEERWTGVYLVPRSGGLATRLVGGFATSAFFRPDASAIDWIRWPEGFEGPAQWGTYWLDSGETDEKALPNSPTAHRWSPDGRWIAMIGGNLATGLTIPVRILDPELRVIDERSLPRMGGWPSVRWGPDSRTLHMAGGNTVLRVAVESDGTMAGEVETVAASLGSTARPPERIDISPDGDKAVFDLQDLSTELMLESRSENGQMTIRSLESTVQWRRYPAVSPDGQRVAFTREDLGGINIYQQRLGGAEAQPLTDSRGWKSRLRWAPDGRTLSYVSNEEDGDWLVTVPSSGGRPNPISPIYVNYSSNQAWLPDSQRLVFPVDQSTLSVHSVEGVHQFSLNAPPSSYGLIAGMVVSASGDSVAVISESFRAESVTVTGLVAPLTAGPVEWAPIFESLRSDMWSVPHERDNSTADETWYSAEQWHDDGRIQFVFSHAYGRAAATVLWEVDRATATLRAARELSETCGAMAVVSFSRDQSRMVCERWTLWSDVWLLEGLARTGRR